jgi:hypothetical protein
VASERDVPAVFFLNLETLVVTMVADAPDLGGDLLVWNDRLYLSNSDGDEIVVFELTASVTDDTITATRIDALTSEFYEGPTNLTLYQEEFLYSVNSISTHSGEVFEEYDAAYASIGGPPKLLSEISLGLLQPGGLVAATNGPVFYLTDLFFGGVRVVDATTGDLFVLSLNSGYLQKTSYGIDLDSATETLFIAGTELVRNGMEGSIFVMNALTGEPIVTCSIIEDFYPTDIAILGDTVYATNSLGSNLVAINVTAAVMNGTCETEIIDLPDAVFTFTDFDVETILGTFC